MWLPPFKYIKGLLADEEVNTNISRLDGTAYTGSYFKTSTGNIYSGDFPSKESERLISNFSEVANREKLGFEEINYQDIKTDVESELSYPTPNDYLKGFFVRYFLKDMRLNKIAEATKSSYRIMLERVYMKGVEVKWILEKPVKDIFNTGYLYKGAATRNRENILEASRELPGLDTFVVDYAQFVDIESDVEGVPFEDLSNADQIRLIHQVQPINVAPPIRKIKPRFEGDKIVTKIRTNLYTNGTRYKIEGTNTAYKGFYHIHPEKGAMVGAVHVSESHSRLVPLSGIISEVDDLTTPTSQEATPLGTTPTTTTSAPLTDGGGGSFGGGGSYGGGGGSSNGGGGSSGGGGGGSSYY